MEFQNSLNRLFKKLCILFGFSKHVGPSPVRHSQHPAEITDERENSLSPDSSSDLSSDKQNAIASNHFSRFRDIVSDPLNLLINRVPESGIVSGDHVTLHNGVRVPCFGKSAYYSDFSSIFIINRGIHEPLEEFVFQCLIDKLEGDPLMVELGAYWGHYSMWFKKRIPHGKAVLVEPDEENLNVGKSNFFNNGLEGEFIKSFVSQYHFSVDEFMREKNITRINILHSDIQGYELEMLQGSKNALVKSAIDYLFISTHSQDLHAKVAETLLEFKYRVEVSADVENETTSFDGFIFASSEKINPLFKKKFKPLGRKDISESSVNKIVEYINQVQASILPR
jgi:hypothetical protein